MPDAKTPELVRLVQRLSACRDLPSVMESLASSLRPILGCDGITVVLRDGDFCFYAEEDAISPLWKGQRFPLESCISGWCMLNREQVAIGEVFADPRIPHDAYRPTFVESLAMTPIRQHEPVGAIGAYWATKHEATAAELDLLQAVGDSAAVAFENVQLLAALAAASRHKDELLLLLAHELRNPLAPIRTYAEILKQRPADPTTTERAAEVIERQVGRLARIVSDLVDTARLQEGAVTLQPRALDLLEVVREVIDDRRSAFDAAGLVLDVRLPTEPVPMEADPERLAQVVDSLLDNACKFTPAEGRVTVRLEDHGGSAEIQVRDTGPGIDPQLLPRVFDTFVQADRSLDRAHGGLGLGLAIAKELVDLHGGSIAVRNPSGGGAAFTVRLPTAGARQGNRRGRDTCEPFGAPVSYQAGEETFH